MTVGRTVADTPDTALTCDDELLASPAAIEADLPRAVTAELTRYLAGKRERCAEIDEDYAAAADDLLRFVLGGGKRLRPTFAWWGWRGAGGHEGASTVLPAVSALELVQGCALVHDDLIDDSATRRGEPTLHTRWTGHHRDAGWSGASDRFGAAIAILLGDVALAWADDMLHDAGLDPAAFARVRPVWAAMRTEVMGGQFLDVHAQAAAADSPEAALRISRYKTAAYTVERPLHLGAALAGAGPELVDAYRRYGTDLGIAFQLRDDLLGVFGDPQVTGKPAGDDLREGKLTLLVALARRHDDRAAAAVVDRAMGDPDLDDDRVEEARGALVAMGVVAEVERRIEELTTSALAALSRVPLASPADDRLVELAAAATRRSR